MGNNQSIPLNQLSAKQVADAVASKGAKYSVYADAIKDNCVDGKVLSSIDLDEELPDIFEELEVTSKLHRKVLTVMLTESAALKPEKEPETVAVAVAVTTDKLTSGEGTVQKAGHYHQAAKHEAHDFGPATEIGLSVYTDPSDLEDFDLIAEAAFMNDPNNVYAGVHLLLADGFQHPLGARYRVTEDIIIADREMAHFDKESSNCWDLVKDKSKVFLSQETEINNQKVMYKGHILKSQEGARLGTICVCSSSLDETKSSEELWLAQLAMITESQLAKKKALVARAESVQESIKAPASLAFSQNLANEEERAHLPPDFFDQSDAEGMPRSPISKNDMERVAAIERMGLLDMDPNGMLANSLARLLSIACGLTGFKIGFFTVLDHKHGHSICTVIDSSVEQYNTVVQALNNCENPMVDKNGKLFKVSTPRCLGPCNYPVHKGQTYVAKDLSENNRHSYWAGLFGCYAGVPIRAADGLCVAGVCFYDFKARDIKPQEVEQLESVALAMEQEIENWSLQREIESTEQERATLMLHQSGADRLRTYVPQVGNVVLTIVVTNVEGIDSLWEADGQATSKALQLHDSVLRSCLLATNGYEMSLEGGCSKLAFEDPVDAVLFVLQAQEKLYHAAWSDNILALPGASVDIETKMRGLRVCMAVHHGPERTAENHDTMRIHSSGKTSCIAKSLVEMCQGGQTLVTSDVWSVTGGLAEALGSPQVLDLGRHVLKTGHSMSDGVTSKPVLQLVPKSLAFSFVVGSSLQAQTNALTTTGRRFSPPILSKHQLSPSFFDSPHLNGFITMVQVDATEGLASLEDSVLGSRALSVLGTLVEAQVGKSKGQQCRVDGGVWVLAFGSVQAGLSFSLSLMDATHSAPFDSVIHDPRQLLKIGVYQGEFSSMGPHPITGRAQYAGVVMSRVTQVTREARCGGIVVGAEEDEIASDCGAGIVATYLGTMLFDGAGSASVTLFACSWGEAQAKWRRLAQRRQLSRRERKIALLEKRGGQMSVPRNMVQVRTLNADA